MKIKIELNSVSSVINVAVIKRHRAELIIMSTKLQEIFERKIQRKLRNLSGEDLRDFAQQSELQNYLLRAEIEIIKLKNEKLELMLYDSLPTANKKNHRQKQSTAISDLESLNVVSNAELKQKQDKIDELMNKINEFEVRIEEKEDIIRILQQESERENKEFQPNFETAKKEKKVVDVPIKEIFVEILSCIGYSVDKSKLNEEKYLWKILAKVKSKFTELNENISQGFKIFEVGHRRVLSDIETKLEELQEKWDSKIDELKL